MKRVLIALALLALAVAGAAAAWYWNESRVREKRGSPSVEFVTSGPSGTDPSVPRRRPEAVLEEPWPTYAYDMQRTHVAPEFDHRPPFRRLWQHDLREFIEFPPAVGYGRVYVASQKGLFEVLDAETGEVEWRRDFGRCLASSPTIADGVVYQSYMHQVPCSRTARETRRGGMLAMDAETGRVLWRFEAGPIESSPLVLDGTIYVGSWDHTLYALNARTHRVRWRYQADDELNTSVAYASGTVFVGSDGGRIYALDARTGALRWQAESYSRFGSREYFYATPAVAYGRVFAGNTDGTVYAYGARTGNLLWAQQAGSYVYAAPAVYKQLVIVGSYDGNVYAFDAGTGDLRWTYTGAPAAIHGAPAVVGDLIYFAVCPLCATGNPQRFVKSGTREIFALDAGTGELVWRRPGLGQYSPAVADEERLYLIGATRVYALRARG